MNEVKFKANKKDVEAIGEQIQEATAALDTTDATAGQVLKVETPGEAPVWGEGGGGGAFLIIDSDDNDNSLTQTAGSIIAALESGQLGLCRGSHVTGNSLSYYGLLTLYTYDDRGNSYQFIVYPFGGTEAWEYTASSLNDYPVPAQ